MITLRDVIRYSNNGVQLVAETEMTEEEFDNIRTTTLLDMDRQFSLPTIVYWYNGGNPPQPIYGICPTDWRGKVLDSAEATSMVNRKGNLLWLIKYKPPTDTAGIEL